MHIFPIMYIVTDSQLWEHCDVVLYFISTCFWKKKTICKIEVLKHINSINVISYDLLVNTLFVVFFKGNNLISVLTACWLHIGMFTAAAAPNITIQSFISGHSKKNLENSNSRRPHFWFSTSKKRRIPCKLSSAKVRYETTQHCYWILFTEQE